MAGKKALESEAQERGRCFYEVSVREHFSAAHRLRGHAGACARLHGHNWLVEVAVRSAALDRLGMTEDFGRLRSALRETLKRFDHADLNKLPEFRAENPSSERIAELVFKEMSAKVNGPRRRVARVTVRETPGNAASYCELPRDEY